jgi:very-short-patch-repair endonuclease
MPQQQIKIRDKKNFIGRVDMLWEFGKRKIVLELDGEIKYIKDPRKVMKEQQDREKELTDAGYEVIRAGSKEVKNGSLIKLLQENSIPQRKNFKGTFPHR